MTIDEINNLQLDDVFSIIVMRVTKIGFDIEEGEGTIFSRLIFKKASDKPLLRDIQAEFLVWKEELIVTENARIAEAVRMVGLETRIKKIKDVRRVHQKLNPHIPNAKKWIEQNILEASPVEAETNLKLLEAAEPSVDLDIEKGTAYKTMTNNIDTKILEVFGTKNRDTANAFAISWKLKADNSIEYVNEGLLDDGGLPLDSMAKIKSYYDNKMKSVIAFDKYMDSQLKIYKTIMGK